MLQALDFGEIKQMADKAGLFKLLILEYPSTFHTADNYSDTSSNPWAANSASRPASWPNPEKASRATPATCMSRSLTSQAKTCSIVGRRTPILHIRTLNVSLIWDVTSWLVYWMVYQMSCLLSRPPSTLTSVLLRTSGHL